VFAGFFVALLSVVALELTHNNQQTRWRAMALTDAKIKAAELQLPAEIIMQKHVAPLAELAMAILQTLKPLTGNSRYIFPSIRNPHRPMSENTINVAIRRMGYGKEEMCAHGFRGMASTLLHEQGYQSDWIERQLAHKEGNEIKAAYNHARHLPERKQMMKAWADYLDKLRDGAAVIQIHKTA